MLKTGVPGIERRRYLRLNSVFPVEFQVLDAHGFKVLCEWKQGFTSNVSSGGLCLSINNLDAETLALLTQKDLQLSLRINIPLSYPTTKAIGSLAWISKTKETIPNQYQLGIKYLMIDKQGLKRIMRYARWMKFTSYLVVILTIIFLGAFGIVFLHNSQLRSENKNLIERLISNLQKDVLAKKEMAFLKITKEELMNNLSVHKNKIKELELKMQEVQSKLQKGLAQNSLLQEEVKGYQDQVENLRQLISLASQEKVASEDKLSQLEEKEKIVSEEIASLNKDKTTIEEVTTQKMLKWLSVHQNSRSGLLSSYEGDYSLKDWAFIYDESLAAQAFILFGDYARAKKIFNFFSRVSQHKFEGFYNAYYSSSGDVAEYTIHAGPNIWIGIALLQYTVKTKDATYLPLAYKIADWLITLQNKDSQGGIRGGFKTAWFSTEHNLDGFAFFNMLYELTQDKKYELARNKILNWLTIHAYTDYSVPVKRGKGDATVATDTYAWSIASLGPKTLKDIGMSPDKVIEFAEENCAVTANFTRPNKEIIEVKGFDFAKYTNMPRGGVVSSEWTAQMVIAYLVMSDFYAREKDSAKEEFYKNKASFYLNELNKLIISSPSPTGQGEGCLPYSTSENADTGHGWRTPKGNSTGSIAGTSYTIFARKNYNPLRINKER